MSARTEFEPLSWEEAEKNRREEHGQNSNHAGSSVSQDIYARSQEQIMEDRCERLRNEIKRGKECLEQVRNVLAELRGRLDDWPAYERNCGRNPLVHYAQSIIIHERIEAFLPGWLGRREERLADAKRELDQARQFTQPLKASGSHPAVSSLAA